MKSVKNGNIGNQPKYKYSLNVYFQPIKLKTKVLIVWNCINATKSELKIRYIYFYSAMCRVEKPLSMKFNWQMIWLLGQDKKLNEGSKQNDKLKKRNLCFLSQRNEILSRLCCGFFLFLFGLISFSIFIPKIKNRKFYNSTVWVCKNCVDIDYVSQIVCKWSFSFPRI